ncbi:MAG: hypothetical protein ACQESF_02140 [Nanobdellota archaeon]
MRKVSMFFFIVGSLISLFNGPFEALGGIEPYMYGLLVFSGLFIGFFNITKSQEKKFFLASLVFIITGIIFKDMLFAGIPSLDALRTVLFNFIIFISSAGFVVAAKSILTMASEGEYQDGFEKKIKEKELEIKSHRAWDAIILLSVAAMFIIFVLKQMFVVGKYANLLDVADFIIWTIFIVDLMFIYERYRDVKQFFKNAWLDIIAVIPFGIFAAGLGELGRLAKLGRLVKIVRFISKAGKAGKVAKFAHLTKITKFFSGDSSFNKYLYTESQSTQKPAAKKKSSKKSKKKKKKN